MILQLEQQLTRIISETQTSWSSESTHLSIIMKYMHWRDLPVAQFWVQAHVLNVSPLLLILKSHYP